MATSTPITLCGNLVDAPTLRFTPNGSAVANFTVASTPRTFDRQTNEWKDGDPMFLNCSVWRKYAENFTETVGDTKGMRVIVTGSLKSRSYETREGEKRTVFEVDVDEIGPALRYATATVTRTQGGGGGGGRPAQQAQSDPWAADTRSQGGDPWSQPQPIEPPF